MWNRGEFDTTVLADSYHVQTNLRARKEFTFEQFQTFVAQAREAIPDLRKEPDDVIAGDEKVVIRYTMTGTRAGELRGIPPTGETIDIIGVAIYRVEDGTLAESWYVSDFL